MSVNIRNWIPLSLHFKQCKMIDIFVVTGSLYCRFRIDTSNMCMVGDRLDTDILFGNQSGCKTLLVLSGTLVN